MREIFTCKFFERGDHGFAVAFADCLTVCAIFRRAAVRVHNDRHKGLNDSESRAHKQVNKSVVDALEAEGGVQLGHTDGEESNGSHQRHIDEAESLALRNVLVKTVTELVRENCTDLVGRHSVYEVIVKDDGLHFAKSREISVELCCAAGSVHYLNSLDLVAMLGQKGFKAVSELAFFERNEFVADAAENGVKEGNDEREAEHCARKDRDHPDADEAVEAVNGVTNKDREKKIEQEGADPVGNEGLARRFVEAVFLLDHHI